MLRPTSTSYPGDYIPPPAPHIHGFVEGAVTAPGIWWFVLTAVVLAVTAFILWAVEDSSRYEDTGLIISYAASAILAAVAAVIAFALAGHHQDDLRKLDAAAAAKHDRDLTASQAAYVHQVRDWLSDEYGITADDASAWALSHGEQRVADTSIGSKLIELRPNTTGSKAVFVVNGDVLPARD